MECSGMYLASRVVSKHTNISNFYIFMYGTVKACTVLYDHPREYHREGLKSVQDTIGLEIFISISSRFCDTNMRHARGDVKMRMTYYYSVGGQLMIAAGPQPMCSLSCAVHMKTVGWAGTLLLSHIYRRSLTRMES
jgi:hypothetical protein